MCGGSVVAPACLAFQRLRVRLSRARRLTNVSRPAAPGSLGVDWRPSRRAKRVGCITGASILDGGCSTGCTGLEPRRKWGSVRHDACLSVLSSKRSGWRCQATTARLHGLEGIRPRQHRHRGDCSCTLGHTDAGWQPPDAAPYSIVLAWKRVEPNRDWLKAGRNEPARERGRTAQSRGAPG